jgi:4-amino-4-deoxy-L-arabinose transferase-like glycosyltransferase
MGFFDLLHISCYDCWRMKMFLRNYWEYITLALIGTLATAIRLYHLQTWFHFQMDQARDAMVIRKAIEKGISYLPLLGPRAGGSFLRLGPAFYYFQYLSAKITRSIEPPVFAYPDLIFNILTVPLFYFFLRLHFKKFGSLLGTALYAFSFIAVQYSRYGWNPNSVPFWTLLLLFSLLKFAKAEREKDKYIWSSIGAVAIGIASQLHFLAFISLPIVAIIFLFWTKSYRNLNFKRVFIVLAILVVIYIPVIFSEIKTGGTNTLEFVSNIKNKPGNNTLDQKLFQTISINSQWYLFILTSYTSFFSNNSPVAGTVFTVSSLLLIFFRFRDEKDGKRKLFFKLIFIWFVVSYLFIFPFAFQTRPRFFFTVYFLPFIFYVFWIEELLDFFRRKKYLAAGMLAAIILTLAILTLNLEAVFAGFQSVAQDRDPKIWNNRPIIQEEIEQIPLYQLRMAADYLAERSWKENKRIHLDGNMTYRAPIQYLLMTKSTPVDFEIMSRYDDDINDLYFSISNYRIGCYDKTKVLLGSELVGTYFIGHRFVLCELRLLPDFESMRTEKKHNEKSKAIPSNDNSKDVIDRNARERVFWGDLL